MYRMLAPHGSETERIFDLESPAAFGEQRPTESKVAAERNERPLRSRIEEVRHGDVGRETLPESARIKRGAGRDADRGAVDVDVPFRRLTKFDGAGHGLAGVSFGDGLELLVATVVAEPNQRSAEPRIKSAACSFVREASSFDQILGDRRNVGPTASGQVGTSDLGIRPKTTPPRFEVLEPLDRGVDRRRTDVRDHATLGAERPKARLMENVIIAQ